MTKTYHIGNQPMKVAKDAYTGLWNIWYAEGFCPKWAGPFRTKKEAVQKLEDAADE